ncbi:hypothetical protein MW887_011839 [Aspergillus wentii]|nr:hypothetical protein MW887_011839 [Aspergillus wentii]
MFYLAQLAAAIYRYSSQLEGDFPSSDFPTYTAHHALLHSSVWRSYYSLPFLTQHTTARFYRLPDLQDLPDSSPLCQPRHRPVSTNILKLPRWAYPIECTRRRQPFLPFATLTAVALSTLETTMARLHTAYPSAPPYSESHARFWLDYFTPNPSRLATVTPQEGPNRFGVLVAQGMYDIHGLEAEYLAQVSEGEGAEGAGESEPVMWCGLPDDAEEREAGQGGCGNHGAPRDLSPTSEDYTTAVRVTIATVGLLSRRPGMTESEPGYTAWAMGDTTEGLSHSSQTHWFMVVASHCLGVLYDHRFHNDPVKSAIRWQY